VEVVEGLALCCGEPVGPGGDGVYAGLGAPEDDWIGNLRALFGVVQGTGDAVQRPTERGGQLGHRDGALACTSAASTVSASSTVANVQTQRWQAAKANCA
jgi:hypothetical protein